MDNRSVQIVKYSFLFLILLFFLVGLFGVSYLAVPILVSGIQFYLFRSVVDSLESYGVPRAITIICIFLALSSAAYWFLAFYLPTVLEKAMPVIEDWGLKMSDPNFEILDFHRLPIVSKNPDLWKGILQPEFLAKSVRNSLDAYLRGSIALLPTMISWLIIIPIISFFLLLDAHLIFKSLVSLVPNRLFEMTLMVLFKMNEQVTSYLKSLVIQSGIMVLVTSLGFYLIGLKFFLLFGVFLGAANSIPYLGPLLGALPPLLFAFLFPEANPPMTAIFLVVLIAQIVDNAIVQPVVIANAVSLHPLLILLGIAVAGNFFGILGMLLAIPVLSIMKVTVTILYEALKEHQIL